MSQVLRGPSEQWSNAMTAENKSIAPSVLPIGHNQIARELTSVLGRGKEEPRGRTVATASPSGDKCCGRFPD